MAIPWRSLFSVVTAGGVAALLVLNWQAQCQTQQKLDALTAAIAERPATPVPAVTEQPATPAPETPMVAPPGAVPQELDKVTVPPYVLETPDILLIQAVLKDPKTGETDRVPLQSVSGQHIVRPDGTVSLGFWGSVHVHGLSLDQASAAIRKHILSHPTPAVTAENLTVVIDVLAYNSKRYYIITNLNDNFGEQVLSFPVTGSETVLDAISNVYGLATYTGEYKIWIERPTPNGQPWQTLLVDWKSIAQLGITTTNYQILPGDRLYVTKARK